MIYHSKSLVLVRKGRAFYATLYQEVFFGNPEGGGSLNVCASTVRDWTIEFIDVRLNLFNLIFQLRTDEGRTDVNKCTS